MIIVLQGFGRGSLYRWGDASVSPPPSVAAAITGKLIHPILTHWTNITTSWWGVALLGALGRLGQ